MRNPQMLNRFLCVVTAAKEGAASADHQPNRAFRMFQVDRSDISAAGDNPSSAPANEVKPVVNDECIFKTFRCGMDGSLKMLVQCCGFQSSRSSSCFWAAFTKIDRTITAAGQVIASDRTQLVQSADGGVLQELLGKRRR